MTFRPRLVAAGEVREMAAAAVEVTIGRRPAAAATFPGWSGRNGSVVILGKPTDTNQALVEAFAALGHDAWIADPSMSPRLGRGDVAVARLDVRATLDGI